MTKFKDQSAELAEVKGHNTSLLIDQQKMSNTLNNTQSTLHALESRLDNEVELKQEIKSLEHQLQTHQHHFEELNTKATVDARLLLEQEEKIMKLEKLNNTLETDNNHLALQTKYAEQKQTDAAGVVQYLEKQFKEIEGTSAQLMEDYLAMQKDLSSNIEQRKSLRRQVSRLEDELKAVQALNSSLHESVQSLQGFYDTSQNQLHYAEKTTSTLDDTIKNLMDTLNAVEQENTYLVDKQEYLPPTRGDFLDAAVIIFGLRMGLSGVHKTHPVVRRGVKKLYRLYYQTGKSPKEILKDIERDESILDDIQNDNVDMPSTYKVLQKKI